MRTMTGFAQDIRQAVRRLSKSPVFTLVALLVLALGIGANTALFTALRAALLDTPPYPQPDRLVMVDLLLERRAGAAADTFPWSYPKFLIARRALRSVEKLAAFTTRTMTLTGAGDAARIGVEFVTPPYFELLGAHAQAGRVFNADDDLAPAPIAILGHALWSARFGSQTDVIRRRVVLDGVSLEVVGVMRPGFEGLSGSAEAWVSVGGLAAIQGSRRFENAWAHWLRALGRLSTGSTLESARAEGTLLGATLTETYPDPSGGGKHGVTMVPFLRARVNPDTRLAVAAVSLGAVVLLLIACANIAGLLLARAAARRTEVAVRAALGAGRLRLARESLLESMLLTLGGGMMGIGLSIGGVRLVAEAVRGALDTVGTRWLQFVNPDALTVDRGVVAIGIAITVTMGLLLGLLPARTVSRPDLTRDLRAGRSDVGARRDTLHIGRSVLVAAQLALSVVLVSGAGLMAASYARLSRVETGFSEENVLTVSFQRGPGPTSEQDRLFEEEALARLSALPGVVSVATAPCPPLTAACETVGVRQIDDQPPADFGDMESVILWEVSSDYFRTLGVRVIEGRVFSGVDRQSTHPVAVLSESAARKFFPGTSPVGHRIAFTHELTTPQLAEIVGVVGDVRYGPLENDMTPAAYLSRQQAPSGYGTLFVNVRGDPLARVGDVRRELAAIAPDLPLTDVTTMAKRSARATARTRVVLSLFSAFAALGLLLSAVGLFGVVSYSVLRRTPEMGLRLALGAGNRSVLRLVMTPATVLAVVGSALGLLAAFVLTRYVRTLLFGVQPSDPRVLAGAAMILISVALLAAWLPARRATRIDPATALRGD
jgi:predicted permease